MVKGKFRKRSSTVWCPKPKDKIIGINQDGIPKIKHCKVTGWVNMFNCDGCPFLEEFHLDNDGVFCLYGIN